MALASTFPCFAAPATIPAEILAFGAGDWACTLSRAVAAVVDAGLVFSGTFAGSCSRELVATSLRGIFSAFARTEASATFVSSVTRALRDDAAEASAWEADLATGAGFS